MKCRHCFSDVALILIDLGSMPLSNAYLTQDDLKLSEKIFPLRVLVCEECWLTQTEDFVDAAGLFNTEYAYFSGISISWLIHSKKYVRKVVDRFSLNNNHHVIEIAANDGCLLQYIKELGIPCTGIEPTARTAKAAREKGMTIIEEFFGTSLANKLISENKQADLMIANNVLAHVPNINDFVAGFSILLKEEGIATFEFPHLMKLVDQSQFDTIYHEHFSYLSLTTVDRIFSANGLSIFDIEEISTHGGSLRVFAQRSNTGIQLRSMSVAALLKKENNAGLLTQAYYLKLQKQSDHIKNEFLRFLLGIKKEGKTVAGYGAAAKGNTMMNYASIRPDLIPFIVDQNIEKQGKFMPGSHIPILNEEKLKNVKPDYIVIFSWNIKTEVMRQLSYVKKWGGRFVTVIPYLEII